MPKQGIPCEVTTSDDDVYLEQDLCVAIFRIFQETLTNISKYAEATRVDVSLVVGEDVVVLEVFDNGRGIARDQLLALLAEGGGVDALVVRSQTRVDAELLAAGAPRLSVVGVASVGIDRIDVPAAGLLNQVSPSSVHEMSVTT